jgi:3-(methylsulfanyl)propanoyl-CoA dehydrogenase
MGYQAPVNDIIFTLRSTAGLDELIAEGLYEGLDLETIEAVLGEAGRFASEVLDDLNRKGDRAGSRLEGGKVLTPPGWAEAYRQFADGGWSALPCPEAFGGQGLPQVVSTAVCEIWNSANLSFGLCPLLTQGAIDAIAIAGSDKLKMSYLPKLVSGEWTGTMNLTEPQAGSDLAQINARAVPQADGTYRIFGTKIFITYGEHELAENIIHLVLARLPDAPPGTRGISLFLVPKRLVGPDGQLGEMNDVVCAGLEEKLGIHASPTCVMNYGEKDGAVGYLVGEENRGLATMFIMMNAARLAVGVQGVAVAERSTQQAIEYARERRQGRGEDGSDGPVPIVDHADVRRMLLTMQAMTQAARSICFATARATDISHRAANEERRAQAADRVALLTPVAKAFSTDTGCEVASLGVQVHGGMGFIEETGAAQYYRDARILPIYEGTNGIQAIDLVLRKLPLGGGSVIRAYLEELSGIVKEVLQSNRPDFGRMGERIGESLDSLEEASFWLGRQLKTNPRAALAGATPYLRLFGITAGGCYLAKGALAAVSKGEGAAAERYVGLARFYAENIAVTAPGLAAAVTSGADALLSVPAEGFEA